ncbi:hypothetical protein BpHYR1_014507, partial [Brachionus plicatilis]
IFLKFQKKWLMAKILKNFNFDLLITLLLRNHDIDKSKSDIAKISPNISKIESISTIAHFQCIFKINIPYISENNCTQKII